MKWALLLNALAWFILLVGLAAAFHYAMGADARHLCDTDPTYAGSCR